ncbi:MAG: outer membrane beta-barrel protein, partial [Bacteroidetes bacterium]|nr:outer membrane beta-barrel protein [Bacteroidota bacterium]
VKKVLVDGKPFFGDDAALALKNITADMVARIEVFDQWSDQAMFTGFDDGQSSKTINIVTKKNVKDGVFSKIYGGYGDNSRYQGGGNFNYFNKSQRFSLLGLTNNINQSNFSMQDISAATGSSAPPMILGRAGGPNNASNPVNNFLVGGQSGINAANSIGLNYSDVWGSKMKFTGSYFFNQLNNVNDQRLSRQYYSVTDTAQLYNESSLNTNSNYNHRANIRFEYYIDSLNSLIATPSFSMQNANSSLDVKGLNSLTTGDSLNQSLNNYNSQNSTYRAINDLLFRHRFLKRGRTISFSLHEEWSNKMANNILQANNYYFKTSDSTSLDQNALQNTPNQSHALAVNYTEPLGKFSQMQFSYKATYLSSYLSFETFTGTNYSALDSSLSNKLQNNFITHLPGMAYRINKAKVMFSVGADYQYTVMDNEQLLPAQSSMNKIYQNVLPNAMFRYKISKNADWRVNLRDRIDLPSANQLQEVWNNNNPLLLSIGNAQLKPQNVWVLYNRFSYTNPVNSSNWMIFVMFRKIENYISNSTTLLKSDSLINDRNLLAGTRYTQPINVDGYWNSRIYVVYGTPIKKLKLNLNLTTGFFSFTTPTLLNNVKGISNSYSFYEAITLSSNISENLDFSVTSTANYNIANNSLQATSYNYFNLQTNAKITYRFWKGVILQSELNHTWYAGLNQNFNVSYALWNSSIAKKMLKEGAGELKFSVFDALQQNNSVSRNVTDTYVDDLKSLVLQRYFMLTFTYKFKKIKSAPVDIDKQ